MPNAISSLREWLRVYKVRSPTPQESCARERDMSMERGGA